MDELGCAKDPGNVADVLYVWLPLKFRVERGRVDG